MNTKFERNEAITKSRWLTLITSCLINLCIGSIYAWSTLSGDMGLELGLESGRMALPFSVANSVGFISMIIGGLLNDKYGPRWVMFGGGLMFSLGMIFSGFAQNMGHLVVSYGILCGLGQSFVYGCTISNTIKFFPDRRGMVGGMTTASYGISSVIIAPIASMLNVSIGVRNAFLLLGAVFLVVICCGSLTMKKCPASFLPTGFTPPVSVGKAVIDSTPKKMLSSRVFYVMIVMLVCGATFGMMFISSAKSIAVNMVGATPTVATLFVSVLCLFNTAGRLVAGTLSDKLGRISTLTGALFVAILGLSVLLLANVSASMPLLAIGLILVGVCFGTYMGVFPGFCTDQFGQKYNTVNYGIMWVGFSVAGIVGPTVLSTCYASSGNYHLALLISLAFASVGFILSFVYRKLAYQE